MTRTERSNNPKSQRGRGGRHGGYQSRDVQVSKALSRLLRHQAVEERIPIDSHGYVRLDHLLSWQRLRSMQPPVTFSEIIEVVRNNEKQRFALKHADSPPNPSQPETAETNEAEAAPETETQRAIAKFSETESHDLTQFFIRANQGHSMKDIEAENLLTPILPSQPNIPQTVVHGTFYGAWPSILLTNGLKPMGRNHIHFATGPTLSEILSPNPSTLDVDAKLDQNRVISGMRRDAQILIYIDIARALADAPDMKWWRSENGVILTEGDVEGLVPMRFWDVVVEVKRGLGVLWKQGEGVVKELPEDLKRMGVPRGKGGGGRNRGGNGRGGGGGGGGQRRPQVNVGKDDVVEDL